MSPIDALRAAADSALLARRTVNDARPDDDTEWYQRDGEIVNVRGFRIIFVRRWFGVRLEFYEQRAIVTAGPFSIRDTLWWTRAAIVNTTWPRVWWIRWRRRVRLPRAIASRSRRYERIR